MVDLYKTYVTDRFHRPPLPPLVHVIPLVLVEPDPPPAPNPKPLPPMYKMDEMDALLLLQLYVKIGKLPKEFRITKKATKNLVKHNQIVLGQEVYLI